jgi:hypothetical protein
MGLHLLRDYEIQISSKSLKWLEIITEKQEVRLLARFKISNFRNMFEIQTEDSLHKNVVNGNIKAQLSSLCRIQFCPGIQFHFSHVDVTFMYEPLPVISTAQKKRCISCAYRNSDRGCDIPKLIKMLICVSCPNLRSARERDNSYGWDEQQVFYT